MNQQEVARFVERYLETSGSRILERSPAHITVKLSPEADKALTNRPYYWGFVERTGAEPETMTFTFVFDEEAFEAAEQRKRNQTRETAANPAAQAQNDTILGRYLGITPTVVQYAPGQPRKETIRFGCGRLDQIFRTVKENGRFVNLFEQPPHSGIRRASGPMAYTSWLCVNYKVAFICDMKRDELYSLGISLTTGEIATGFHDRVSARTLSPRLPSNTRLQHNLALPRAAGELERYIETLVLAADHAWAEEAHDRLLNELARIDGFYEELLRQAKDEEERSSIAAQHEARRAELEWQHRPRIEASAINCGLFHLLTPP